MSTPQEFKPVTLVLPTSQELESQSLQNLKEVFEPLYIQAEEWRQKALACKVSDEGDVQGMKFARDSRLALRSIRTEVERRRKAAKEDSLRKGKAIDAMANTFKAAVEPIEAFLLEQEEFAIRAQAKRSDELRKNRIDLIAPYRVSVLPDLAALSEAEFQNFLAEAKELYELRLAREKRENEERQRREEEGVKLREEDRVRLENERLKAQAAKQEEARIKAEHEAALLRNAEIERQAKAEQDRKAQEEQIKRDQAAPDRDKILAFAAKVRALQIPVCTTTQGKSHISQIAEKVQSFAKWIEQHASAIQ